MNDLFNILRLKFLYSSMIFTFLFLNTSYAISLDDLEDNEEEVSQESSGKNNIEWSGIIDMKTVNAGKSKNWASPHGEYGGPGLSRYGSETGKSRATNFHMGMIGLVLDTYHEEEHSSHIQMNFSDHRTSATSEWGHLGIAEAYLLENFGPIEAKFGFLIPPISLEHPNVAWSTKYTFTPSAINSWVGEEVRSLGLEIDINFSDYVDFLIAGFSHNDSIATMLTYRGWALHDYQGTYGTRLRWNKVSDEINKTSGWVEPFKELDDKPGAYGKISLHTLDHTTKFELFYYDNFANPSKFDGFNYAWKTSFWNISFSQKFANGLQFLSQYMFGQTKMGPVDVVKADFNAGYALITFHTDPHRLSFRVDDFKVSDIDNFTFPSGTVEKNDSKGQALTAAYMYDLSENKTLGLEAVSIKSERDGNEGYGDTDPDDDLYQFVYRLTF